MLSEPADRIFILPFSHDEMTHGKRSMLEKIPGDAWQKFATLRLLYTHQICQVGKKLLFMGAEFAQGDEWCCDRSLSWELLEGYKDQAIYRNCTRDRKLLAVAE